MKFTSWKSRINTFITLGSLLGLAASCAINKSSNEISESRESNVKSISPEIAAPTSADTQALPPNSVVVMAAGDIQTGKWSPTATFEKTAQLLDKNQFEYILGLGDMSNSSGSVDNYAQFDRAWGRHKNKILAVPGSHDDYRFSLISTGRNFYDYFNGPQNNDGLPATNTHTGPRNKGYFSQVIGAWLLIGLNFCATPSHKFSENDEQMKWLSSVLKAKPVGQPVIVIEHTPRYTKASNHREDEKNISVAWKIFEAYKPDVRLFLSAHMNGIYERWQVMNNQRQLDARGIRSFTVGTGGMHPYTPGAPDQLLEKSTNTYGVLKLTLRPNGYDWKFLPIDTEQFTDEGTLNF